MFEKQIMGKNKIKPKQQKASKQTDKKTDLLEKTAGIVSFS